MANSFDLNKQLQKDCLKVTELPLCLVLLMNDSRFPWLILVPKRSGLRDFHDIANADRIQLFDEIEACSNLLDEFPGVSKINVAALGNQVPQLHIHVIGRNTEDEAWPGPVWGVGEVVPYSKATAVALVDELKQKIGAALTPTLHAD